MSVTHYIKRATPWAFSWNECTSGEIEKYGSSGFKYYANAIKSMYAIKIKQKWANEVLKIYAKWENEFVNSMK